MPTHHDPSPFGFAPIGGRAVVAAFDGGAITSDAGAHRYLRIGACAGLAGIAVQSIWEAGLRAPANLLLAAIVAAIAVRPIDRAHTTPTTEHTPA